MPAKVWVDESKRCGHMIKPAAQAKKGGETGRPRQRNDGQEVFPKDGQEEGESIAGSGSCMCNGAEERKVMDGCASGTLTRQKGRFCSQELGER